MEVSQISFDRSNQTNYYGELINRTVGLNVLHSPDHAALADFISRAHTADELVTIHATCSVEYTGNREGELGSGDRVVICKGDGAVAVHRPTGARAVARQGIGSSLETVLLDDCVRIYAAKGQSERIRVDITDASLAVRDSAVDDATLQENQTEAQMHEYILSNPEEIEANLRILEHERQTPYGRVDFFAADADGNSVILEIKQPEAEYSHVDQLQRYVSYFRTSDDATVRGILVAPSIGSGVKRLLRRQNLEWVQLKQYQVNETSPGQTSFDDWC
ncbi:endonuclease NucS domain-containing protein [Halosolutus halophilus]|uniref:endonuclease NucS domain-containing protein n=1 Tax=Halosolutus halophilus TaxID=1552990 RepID=UPI00223520BA|nr:endonuclease NucS domain-containing protein [Halosolutus halophilus]